MALVRYLQENDVAVGAIVKDLIYELISIDTGLGITNGAHGDYGTANAVLLFHCLQLGLYLRTFACSQEMGLVH